MKLGTLIRTVRHLRPTQAWAQLRHVVGGGVAPVAWRGAPPVLRVREPAAAFLPAPPHARFDGFRRIELANRGVSFREQIDWEFEGEGPLWSYHLHEFHYTRREGVSPATRAALMLDWIERHPAGIGWDPHPLSLRILSWAKLLLTPGALELDDASRVVVLTSLAAQVETLAQNLEVRLQANHLLSNLIGVVFGGLLFEGDVAEAWYSHGGALDAQIREQIGPDGAHVERSPMYHSLLLENLLDLLNLARAAGARGAGLAKRLEVTTEAMLGALAAMTHPDDQIALLGDAAFGIAHPPAALRGYAESLGVRARPGARAAEGILDSIGVVRLEAPPFALIASVGGVMPAYQPGHAHCDALSFELSVGRERIVTDTGVAEYIPGALRAASRATASHATLRIAGQEQAEVWSAHRVGGRPRVELVSVVPGRRLEATVRSWAPGAPLHRRAFALSQDSLEIHDAVEGRPRPVRMSLPIAPGLDVRLVGPGARVRLASGQSVDLDLPQGPGLGWRIESTPYFPQFGRHVERPCLVGEAPGFTTGVWRFRLSWP